ERVLHAPTREQPVERPHDLLPRSELDAELDGLERAAAATGERLVGDGLRLRAAILQHLAAPRAERQLAAPAQQALGLVDADVLQAMLEQRRADLPAIERVEIERLPRAHLRLLGAQVNAEP